MSDNVANNKENLLKFVEDIMIGKPLYTYQKILLSAMYDYHMKTEGKETKSNE